MPNESPKNKWEGSWTDFYEGNDITGISQTGGGSASYGKENSQFWGYMRGYGYISTTTESTFATNDIGVSWSQSYIKGKYVGPGDKWLNATPAGI